MGNYDRLFNTMLPVLFSLGPLAISSFGLFLALSFLYSTFLVWRLSRAWDLDEEKVLDFCLLIFLGGLIGARILYALFNPPKKVSKQISNTFSSSRSQAL